MGMIYKATNGLNGMAYIGITDHSLERIKQEHATTAQSPMADVDPFLDAIREYSAEAFVYETLQAKGTVDDLESLIYEHATHVEGYNALTSPFARTGKKPKARKATKKKKTGKPHSEETKAKISRSLTGRRRSPAECQAISDGHAAYDPEKSFYDDPSYKEKISAGNRGKKRSAAHKQALREGQNRRWHGVRHRPGAFDE